MAFQCDGQGLDLDILPRRFGRRERLRTQSGRLARRRLVSHPAGEHHGKSDRRDCVELARSPSCVHIYYVRAGTLEGRTTAVQRAARDAEWTRTLYDVLPGGTQLGFLRDRLRAAVFLELDHSAAACRRDPKRQCADVVMVEGTQ